MPGGDPLLLNETRHWEHKNLRAMKQTHEAIYYFRICLPSFASSAINLESTLGSIVDIFGVRVSHLVVCFHSEWPRQRALWRLDGAITSKTSALGWNLDRIIWTAFACLLYRAIVGVMLL